MLFKTMHTDDEKRQKTVRNHRIIVNICEGNPVCYSVLCCEEICHLDSEPNVLWQREH